MILFIHRDPKSFGDDVAFYAADAGLDAFENITFKTSLLTFLTLYFIYYSNIFICLTQL